MQMFVAKTKLLPMKW